jgi:hypothetical protein
LAVQGYEVLGYAGLVLAVEKSMVRVCGEQGYEELGCVAQVLAVPEWEAQGFLARVLEVPVSTVCWGLV